MRRERQRWRNVFKCPVKGCGFISSTLYGLKAHVKSHYVRKDVCPACGKRFNNVVEHLEYMAKYDELHAVWHYLLRSPTRRRKSFKRSQEIAYRVLSV